MGRVNAAKKKTRSASEAVPAEARPCRGAERQRKSEAGRQETAPASEEKAPGRRRARKQDARAPVGGNRGNAPDRSTVAERGRLQART